MEKKTKKLQEILLDIDLSNPISPYVGVHMYILEPTKASEILSIIDGEKIVEELGSESIFMGRNLPQVEEVESFKIYRVYTRDSKRTLEKIRQHNFSIRLANDPEFSQYIAGECIYGCGVPHADNPNHFY
jgi:hypothetical protein